MRCKPNQMCWIRKSDRLSQVGAVVKVEYLYDHGSRLAGEPIWVVSLQSVMVGVSGRLCVGLAQCPDDCLTPINDPGLSVETDADVPVEEGVV